MQNIHCRPGWPQTYCGPHSSASQVRELRACAITSLLKYYSSHQADSFLQFQCDPVMVLESYCAQGSYTASLKTLLLIIDSQIVLFIIILFLKLQYNRIISTFCFLSSNPFHVQPNTLKFMPHFSLVIISYECNIILLVIVMHTYM